MADKVLPAGAPLVPGPSMEGYSLNPSKAAVEGFNVGGTIQHETGPPSEGATVTTLLGGSGAYGCLAGQDRIFHNNAGVYGESDQQGVFGTTTKAGGTGVYAFVGTHGFGVRGEAKGGGTAIQGTSLDNSGPAAAFNGDVNIVSGDLVLSVGSITLQKGDVTLVGGDCAEHFDASDAQELAPGTVVVFTEDGTLAQSDAAYDKKVAGVVSGAGNFKPAIVLNQRSSNNKNRVLVALFGTVFCSVDAEYSPVQAGDLLTTSATPGHAMKASDPARAFGAVIGKALRALPSGRALIPVLVSLQ